MKDQSVQSIRMLSTFSRFPRLRVGLTIALGFASTLIAAHDSPLNADDPNYLRRQYAWFQVQEPPRQQQLRRLHAGFQELDPATQSRYTLVMQNYNAWLAKLPEEERQRVLAAPTANARLEVVRLLREREWVDTLPRVYRDEYAALPVEARRAKVQEWRADEADRKEEWALAQRQWTEPAKFPKGLLGDGKALEAFVKHLRDNLSESEKRELDEARGNAEEMGNSFAYLLRVVRFADRHPILPGKVGPKDFDSLPEPVKTYLIKNDPHFRKKGLVAPNDEIKVLKRSSGRWPEFALELVAYCQKKDLKLPGPALGDCRKEQMPPEVIQFLDRDLEPRLKKPDAKADIVALNEAQGKWPDYPRTIVELARKYKMPIPGWTLPGPPREWDLIRPVKPKR